MNRRNFIKTSSLLLAIPVVLPVTGKLNKFLSSKVNAKSFSLNVITSNADEALPELQEFISSLGLEKGIIKYSENKLSGIYKSDLTYVENNRLINYKTNKTDLTSKLSSLQKKLNLSSEINDPVLIKMYNFNFVKAKELYVYNGEKLQQKITLTDDERHYTIKGPYGELTLEVKNFKAKVLESSCTHKTCMKMDAISYSGDSLICIPNRMNITAI
jgi:hypothetical protein